MQLRRIKPIIGKTTPAFAKSLYYNYVDPVEKKILLMFPFLYRTNFVNYESSVSGESKVRLLELLDKVLGVEGNIIECGSDLFGTTVIMANYLREKHIHKIIYGCDSFEGFDHAELENERQIGLTKASDMSFTTTSYGYVRRKIRKLGVEDIVIPVRGFFQETLPHIKSDFCFAFVDCDLELSITYSAETIWPDLASDGCIVFDDYTNERFRGGAACSRFICKKT